MSYTKKQVKELANSLNAANMDEISQCKKEDIRQHCTTIALSFGIYGMNSGIIRDDTTGMYYYIPCRNTDLFYFA